MSQNSAPKNKQTTQAVGAEPLTSNSTPTSKSASASASASVTTSPSSPSAQYANFTLQSTDLDPVLLKAQVNASCTGAVVTFEGLVRDHNEGKSVSALTYEAFEPLCRSEAEKIFAEAQSRHPFHKAICHHRIGDLAIGDMAVYVAVSSPHRDEAFKACRYIIDEIKHRLPIWKKETYLDGTTVWVNCSNCQSNTNSTNSNNHNTISNNSAHTNNNALSKTSNNHPASNSNNSRPTQDSQANSPEDAKENHCHGTH